MDDLEVPTFWETPNYIHIIQFQQGLLRLHHLQPDMRSQVQIYTKYMGDQKVELRCAGQIPIDT